MQGQDDSEFYRALLRAYIDSASDGIFVVCDEMKFHVANPLLQSWFGVPEAELTAHGQRLPITHFIRNAESVRLFEQQFQRALAHHPVRFECLFEPENAPARWIEISLNRVNLEVGELFIGIARDIDERRTMLAMIEHHETHDLATGVANRQAFERRLERLLADARPQQGGHALIYFDLDKFAVLNGAYGHAAGDALLRLVARSLKADMFQGSMLARLGPDEFGLLLENCPLPRAAGIAEAHRAAIQAIRFAWQGKAFDVSTSIGVVPIGTGNLSVDEVLGHADAACRLARERGGNRVQLSDGGEAFSLQRETRLQVAEISRALEEDRFQLHFQKVAPVGASDVNCGHYEILLRMLDEQGGMLFPAQFMPAAEKYHLMPAVDRWVVRTLFASHAAYWREPGMAEGGFCAINLSGASLNDEDFPAFLSRLIEEYRVPPQMLCFEITETVAVRNLQQVSEFIRELKRIGCRFALDDFGSGMSSFSYLRSLDVDFLKIDGSLVRDIATDPVSYVMVESINRIGKSMNISTIAEYVENKAILNKLRAIGVDYAQGYGIHRPERLSPQALSGG